MALSLINVGARAMSANYAALQTAGHNIANYNVKGYSRQQVNLETAPAHQTSGGFLGSGVDINSVTRAHDSFLAREVLNTGSQAALDSKQLQLMAQLENVFPTGDAGVGAAAGQFYGTLSDLASHPGDIATREVVLSSAGELAQRLSGAGQQVESLQASVATELKTSVESINSLSSQLAELNDQIMRQQASGQSPNDLLDQRDQLVQQLGGYLQVTTMTASDGTVSVYAAGGLSLVSGAEAQSLQMLPDELDPSRVGLGVPQSNGSVRRLDSAVFTGGGSVGALLRFQNQDLVGARNTLGQMATALAARFNEQQARGLDLGTPPGAGKALFTDFVQQSLNGQLKALPAEGNGKDVLGRPLTEVAIHIDDASLLQADEYTLEANGNGSFVMTRASDGTRFLTTDGSTFSYETQVPGNDQSFHPGFSLQISGAGAVGDRFLVQPVGHAAAQLQRVLDDPKGLAAAAPATVTAAATNTGTGTVSGFTVTADAATTLATLPGKLTFTDAAGGYSWTQVDAAGNAVGTPQTGLWQKGQALALPGLSLQLAGQPKQGDVFNLAVTTSPSGNNGNALALARVGDEAMVGRSYGIAGSTGGTTVVDAWADALAGVGARVQSATTASDISAGVASAAQVQRDSSDGVDLDEEAAKLIQFQKSYQAAAKVLQVAQSVFDTLLQATSR